MKEFKKISRKTSIDNDNISYRILKEIPDELRKKVFFLFKSCLRLEILPTSWKMREITMIPKKGCEKTSFSGIRPISILLCIFSTKIIYLYLNNRALGTKDKHLTNKSSSCRIQESRFKRASP